MASDGHGVKLDLTINIPVMITVVSLAISGAVWVAKVEAKAEYAALGVDSLKKDQEVWVASVKQELAAMRSESRLDMRDLQIKVDQIIWRLGDPPAKLKEWERK